MRLMWWVIAIHMLSNAAGFFAVGQTWVALAELALAALCVLLSLSMKASGVVYIDEVARVHHDTEALAEALAFCSSRPGRRVLVINSQGLVVIINPRGLRLLSGEA